MPQLNARMLWGTPILDVINPDHAAIKQGLMEHCRQIERRDGGGIASKVAPGVKYGLYESGFDFFKAERSEVRELHDFCAGALRSALVSIDQQLAGGRHRFEEAPIELHESWAHVTRDGGFHEAHLHPNCSWCGIYCVEPGDSSENPPNGLNRFFPPFQVTYEDPGVDACALWNLSIAPQAGRLVLFPSYIRHSADLYRGRRERVVVAFNARVPVNPPR